MTQTTSETRPEAGAWLVAVAEPTMLAVLLLYLLYQFVMSHVEGDQAYLLYAAQQVLHGVQLDGPQLIETNPPMIVWFSTIPAALAQLLHISAVTALRLVTLAMLAGSAAWGWRLMRLSGVAAMQAERVTRALWAATFLLIVITQPAEFGQREQLVLALLLPYLLATGTNGTGQLRTVERIALGLCAGLAVCLKPQQVLTLICLECFLAVYFWTLRRLLSAELLVAVATGLLYVAAVWLTTPAYLFVIKPLLQSTYWALGEYTYTEMILHVGRWLTLVTLLLSAVWFAARRRLALPQLSGAVLASAFGAWSAYVVQHTGWYHQRFPAVALLEIGAVWMTADLLHLHRQGMPVARRLQTFAWVALPLCALVVFSVVLVHKHRSKPSADDLQAELARLPQGTTVYAFSVGMDSFPVVIERHLVWGSRFAHLWMLPAIRASEVPAPGARSHHPLDASRVTELAELQRRDTAEDLLRTHPEVIFVQRCDTADPCESYSGPFPAVQWFSQDKGFADIWSHYQFQKSINGFNVYRRN